MSDDKYPPFRGVSPNASGSPLTFSMVKESLARLTDPVRREQETKRRDDATAALNLDLKTRWAKSLGKTVDQLTKEDMEALNERCFQAWLKYKGITENDFREFFGV